MDVTHGSNTSICHIHNFMPMAVSVALDSHLNNHLVK
jgi:hypothetical protein